MKVCGRIVFNKPCGQELRKAWAGLGSAGIRCEMSGCEIRCLKPDIMDDTAFLNLLRFWGGAAKRVEIENHGDSFSVAIEDADLPN